MTNSLESGFQAPFGKIDVFIGFIGRTVHDLETAADSISGGATLSDSESSG